MFKREFLVHHERMAEFHRAAAKERLAHLARAGQSTASRRPLIVITPRRIFATFRRLWTVYIVRSTPQPNISTPLTTGRTGKALWVYSASTTVPVCKREITPRRLRSREEAQAAARRLAR